MTEASAIEPASLAAGGVALPREGSPPRIRLCCTIGVTGHRTDALNGDSSERLAALLTSLLADVRGALERLTEVERQWFAPLPPRLRFLSPLAPGADQIAAEAALDAGYSLSALLPFEGDEYEEDFSAEELASQRDVRERAEGVLELPGERKDALDAYLMAGRATVAHADLMIAVWDGLPARGRGGTGEIVELALRRGKPVLHVQPSGGEIRILWSGFDPLVTATQVAEVAARPYSIVALDSMIHRLMAPPDPPAERAHLAAFLAETERRVQTRIEYPLLLAAMGIRRLRRTAWHSESYVDATRAEWSSFRAACAEDTLRHKSDVDSLERCYCWADRLAQHYAQTYRSGHVLNFLLAAGAVLLALSGLLFPGGKLLLSLAELALIGGIIVNTRLGTRREWHRRWLDYRNLAERLRPMRSLKLLGLAQPPADPVADQRWIGWLAAAVWRMLEPPAGRLNQADVPALTRLVAKEELKPQIDYHRANASQLKRLDHRLHRIGNLLFLLTITACLVSVVGYLVAPAWVGAQAKSIIFVSAGLPALGTAIFGIRVQGDFSGTAERSRATAERLEALLILLEDSKSNLSRAADLVEAAAQTMLSELSDWRVSYSQRKLVIPA